MHGASGRQPALAPESSNNSLPNSAPPCQPLQAEYCLKGEDMPADDSWRKKYSKRIKAVKQRSSKYVNFEAATEAEAEEADE